MLVLAKSHKKLQKRFWYKYVPFFFYTLHQRSGHWPNTAPSSVSGLSARPICCKTCSIPSTPDATVSRREERSTGGRRTVRRVGQTMALVGDTFCLLGWLALCVYAARSQFLGLGSIGRGRRSKWTMKACRTFQKKRNGLLSSSCIL